MITFRSSTQDAGPERRQDLRVSRPHKKIHHQRVYPKQTGFQDGLYEKKGVTKSIAQQVEDKFMSPVDNFAAKALDMIEADVDQVKKDAEQTSVWSIFLTRS
ncbi:DUF4238 domain-containing protein [Bradyrhizobium sp. 139]|uniref:DUF4238 domain-containing protein n=1 Tax=Bradyrhizobium sp. 139 TaxID=2782616 RepID=UPI0031FEAF47